MNKNDSVHRQLQEQLQVEYDREKELLQKLLQRVGDLEKVKNEKKINTKQRNRLERQYMSITRHPLWFFIWPIRKVSSLTSMIKRRFLSLMFGVDQQALRERYKKLAEDKAKLSEELEAVRKQLRLEKKRTGIPIVEWQEPDLDHLRQSLQMIKEDGDMPEYLNELILKRNLHDRNYRTALKYVAVLYANDKLAAKDLIYEQLLAGLKIEEVPEIMLRSKSDQNDEAVSLRQIASFRACLTMQSRIRQLEAFRPEWELDHKEKAYAFIDKLKVRRPWVAEERFTYTDVPHKEGFVIKPVHSAGSRGVYLVFKSDHIQDVKRSRVLTGWAALQASMRDDLLSGQVSHDQWLAEELFYENKEHHIPARDMKFYCFYGKVSLILEIQRFPEVKYCWWAADGQRIHTGKYEGKLFVGEGISADQVELAASISAEIPAPFIRIDFLKTEHGLVFGEFAAKPGNYDEFDLQTDQQLGDDYLQAQGRLITDLLHGKSFEHFKQLLS